MQVRGLFLHALSPLHAGIGQGSGSIDLPIAREKTTGIPFLPASSVKGVLRDACKDSENQNKLFGNISEKNNGNSQAGKLQFTDMSLLCLPVRSFKGTFAWVSSPFILKRFMRDMNDISQFNDLKDIIKTLDKKLKKPEEILIPKESKLILEGEVIFEDLNLTVVKDSNNSDDVKGVTKIANTLAEKIFHGDEVWQELFKERFCIVSDEVMSYFFETAMEINARIRLDEETKTVTSGALWYEENLPTETILYGLLFLQGSNNFEKVEKLLGQGVFQFGGNATIGRGLCRLELLKKSERKK